MSIISSFYKILNQRQCFSLNRLHNKYNLLKYSTQIALHYDKDPGPAFLDPEVQKILKSITRGRLDKIFKKKTVKNNSIEYKFMTNEELEKEYKNAIAKAECYMQMPPVVKVKEENDNILSKDPALQGFSECKFVITDITYGKSQDNRKILVRDTDGTLRYASENIRKRMNQIYFPLEGRKLRTPHMFESEWLEKLLNNSEYLFILDRLCIQFEPYEKDFYEISSKVYEHINENKDFEILRSTRHFGPMAFYFAWHKNIDNLLFDMIKQDYLRNGVELIVLMYHINNIDYDKTKIEKIHNFAVPNDLLHEMKKSITPQIDDIHEEIKNAIGKTDLDFDCDEICVDFINEYINENAVKKVPLQLAIQSFQETNDEKKKLYKGLKKAHGVN